MPIPAFLLGVEANLAYWQARAGKLDDLVVTQLVADRKNLYRAVQTGLAFSETQHKATELALALFDFIELGSYWREWIPVLKQATEAENPSASIHIRLLNQLGFLHMLNREIALALSRHQEAEVLAKKMDAMHGRANALFGLCNASYAAHQYTDAMVYGAHALNLFMELNSDPKKLAATYNIVGMTAHAQGDYSAAETNLLHAVAIRRQLDSSTLLAQFLSNLAITLQAQKKYEQALDCYNEAIALLENGASLLTKIHTQNSLGHLYFELARYEEAEAMFLSTDAAYLRRSGLVFWLAQRANNLGNVYLKQNRLKQAKQLLREALNLWREIGDEINLANTLGDLAETLSQQNETEKAIPLYEEANQILARYSQNAWARARREKLMAQSTQIASH